MSPARLGSGWAPGRRGVDGEYRSVLLEIRPWLTLTLTSLPHHPPCLASAPLDIPPVNDCLYPPFRLT